MIKLLQPNRLEKLEHTMEPEKQKGRGGKREGAGRKPGYESTLKKEPTKVIRVPVSLAENIDELLELKSELAQLQEQLAAIQAERDKLLKLKEKLRPFIAKTKDIRDHLREVSAKIQQKQKGYAANSASGLIAELKNILINMETPLQ